MGKVDILQTVLYLLPVVSYLFGKSRNMLRVPRQVRWLLENHEVIETILRGIEAAESMEGKSDDEKREYVRAWVKSELYKLLGEWLPDSAINFLIEHAIVRQKG